MKPPKASAANAARAATLIYSTSEARAHFAEALETAQKESAVIGFDRYGRTVAALAPIEAILILAGRGDEIAPEVRRNIERSARNLVQDIQHNGAQPKDEGGRGKSSFARAGLKPSLSQRAKSKMRPKS